jgi:hypothetical protein
MPYDASLHRFFRCDQDVRFGGIIYLHDISMSRDFVGAFDMTSTILSIPEIARHVLFATVKWREPEILEQQHREQLMITKWKTMIDRGAQVARLTRTTSLWSIVDNLLDSTVELGAVRRDMDMVLGELLAEKPARRWTRQRRSSLRRWYALV